MSPILIHSTTASILNLAAISLDRYFHIKDPLSYERWMTRRIIIVSIVIIWSLSAMVSFLPISLGWHRPPHIDMSEQISSSSASSSSSSTSPLLMSSSSSQFTSLSSSSTSSIPQSNSHQLIASHILLNAPTFAIHDEYHATQSKSSSSSSSKLLSQPTSVPLSVINRSNNSHWSQINNDTDTRKTAIIRSFHQEQSDNRLPGVSSSTSRLNPLSSSSSSSPSSSLSSSEQGRESRKGNLLQSKRDKESNVNVSPAAKLPLHLSKYFLSGADSVNDSNDSKRIKQVDSSEIVRENTFIESELNDKSRDFNDADDDDDEESEYDTSPQCALDLTPVYAVVSSAISFYIPCLIMIGLYTQLYLYAKKHVQNIRSFQVSSSNTMVDDHEAQVSSSLSCTKKRNDHQHNVTSGGNNSGNLSHHPHQVTEHKAAITLGIIMGTFLLCWVRITIVC